MSDLTDLRNVGHDARAALTAFTVTMEALSDPHFQFKPFVAHLRAALFLLDSARETVGTAADQEERRRKPPHLLRASNPGVGSFTPPGGFGEAASPELSRALNALLKPGEHAAAQTAQEPASATNAPGGAVPVEPAPASAAAAAPEGARPLPADWDEGEVSRRVEAALMEAEGGPRAQVDAALVVLLASLPRATDPGIDYDNARRKASVLRGLQAGWPGGSEVRRLLGRAIEQAEYVGD